MRTSLFYHFCSCLALALVAGCKETTNTEVTDLVPTYADAIASKVSEHWQDPNGDGINPALDGSVEFRVFRNMDGSGLVAITEGAGWNGYDYEWTHLYIASVDAGGTMRSPVRIQGDHTSVGSLSGMLTIFTPSGDAVISYLGREAVDPANDEDFPAKRVYYTTFKRALSATPTAADGEAFGFATTPEKLDTNVAETNDTDVQGLFAASSLFDGNESFWGAHDLEYTGQRSDPSVHFLFLGWVHTIYHEDSDSDKRRLEGRFVDLNTLAISPGNIAIPTSPSIADEETIDLPLLTSGRDIVFRWTEIENANGVWQDRVNLVRVNDQATGFETTVDVTRGESTDTGSSISGLLLLGDGFRVLNGQQATWFVFEQSGFQTTTISQSDSDLIFARVDNAGGLQIAEFDHNASDAEIGVALGGFQVDVGRGATRAVVHYRQRRDVAEPTESNIALFTRAIRISDSGDLADNVSDEIMVSTTQSTSDPIQADVHAVWDGDHGPFDSPQTDNNVFGVAFSQRIAGDADTGMSLKYAKLTIGNASDTGKPTLTCAESVIVPDQDLDWHVGFTNGFGVELADSGSDGNSVVFFVGQGNNVADDENSQGFAEARLYAFSPSFSDGQTLTTPVELCSGANVSLANWCQVKWMSDLAQTPYEPATRDFAWNDDERSPDFLHAIFREEAREVGGEEVFRARAIDLRPGVGVNAQDRFFPGLESPPTQLGTGAGVGDIDLVAEGNYLLAQFSEAPHGNLKVNTFEPNARLWSTPALLSNDKASSTNGNVWASCLSAGVSNGRMQIVGSWSFWMRGNNLQTRQFRGLVLPR